jgi:hypothetical protein
LYQLAYKGRDSVHQERDRLEADVAKQFLAQVVKQARVRSSTCNEYFTVDGTQRKAWAGAKNYQPKGKEAASSDKSVTKPSSVLDFGGINHIHLRHLNVGSFFDAVMFCLCATICSTLPVRRAAIHPALAGLEPKIAFPHGHLMGLRLC